MMALLAEWVKYWLKMMNKKKKGVKKDGNMDMVRGCT